MVGNINSKVMTPLAVFLLAIAVTSGAWAGNPGESGLLSLRMGIGAREAAMGETGVASSEGAAAVFWAGLAQSAAIRRSGFALLYHLPTDSPAGRFSLWTAD